MDSSPSADLVFDRKWVLEQIGGDADLLHDIIEVFLVDCPDIRQQINAALHAGELKALHAAAHCAKSAVGNFGAPAAVKAAIELEEATKKGETAQLELLTNSLCQALIEVENTLRLELV